MFVRMSTIWRDTGLGCHTSPVWLCCQKTTTQYYLYSGDPLGKTIEDPIGDHPTPSPPPSLDLPLSASKIMSPLGPAVLFFSPDRPTVWGTRRQTAALSTVPSQDGVWCLPRALVQFDQGKLQRRQRYRSHVKGQGSGD